MRRTHVPRILLLYGSFRERSYSRFLTLEAERLLGTSAPRRVSSIPTVCRYRMLRRVTIQRSGNFVSCRNGPRGRSGPHSSGTAR